MNLNKLESAGKIVISELNKKEKVDTPDLIRALKRNHVLIEDERDFRYIIAGLNTKLNPFGMRIKWIPEDNNKDRWILVIKNSKPSFVTPQIERCLIGAILLSANNSDNSFKLEDILNLFNTESSDKLSNSVSKLISEGYIKRGKENKLLVSKKVFTEINVHHLLTKIRSF